MFDSLQEYIYDEKIFLSEGHSKKGYKRSPKKVLKKQKKTNNI